MIDARQIAARAAHPDDETIGCGAQLPRLSGITIVTVTDGAARDLVDRRSPPSCGERLCCHRLEPRARADCRDIAGTHELLIPAGLGSLPESLEFAPDTVQPRPHRYDLYRVRQPSNT
jgi:hypothetical protein